MMPIKWDDQADVVVIGSGLAGLSAAIEALTLGSTVIVLEKMNVSGGNSRISDGGLAAPGSFVQIVRWFWQLVVSAVISIFVVSRPPF